MFVFTPTLRKYGNPLELDEEVEHLEGRWVDSQAAEFFGEALGALLRVVGALALLLDPLLTRGENLAGC